MKKPTLAQDPRIQRLLPPEVIGLAFEAIAQTRSPLKRMRDHFMLSLFYLTGLRTFEATTADMRDLRRAPAVSTGCQSTASAASGAKCRFPRRCSRSWGLPAAVAADEDTPLLAANSKGKRASNSTVLKAMIDLMTRAADLARAREEVELAERLADARVSQALVTPASRGADART